MTRDEKVFLGLALAALAAIVIFQRPQTVAAREYVDPIDRVGNSLTPRNDSVVKGPEYMTYNQPWFFAPPIGNFLPSITAGLGSQTVNQPTDFVDPNDCGCN